MSRTCGHRPSIPSSRVCRRDVCRVGSPANEKPGAEAGLWSGYLRFRVARRLRTGQVDINGGSFNPLAPFGGYKQSGNGRELGRYGLEEYLETKSLQL